MRPVISFLLAALWLTAICSPAQAAPKTSPPNFNHYFSRDEHGAEQAQTFSLNDRIYLHIHFSRLDKGKHHLQAFWWSPKGKLQEKTGYRFTLAESQPYQAYVWLSFTSSGWFSKFQSRNLTMPEFMGLWRVEIFFNQQKLLEGNFSVE
jgi:hypothetical protein